MSGLLAVLDRISEALEPHGVSARGVAGFGPGEGPLLADGSRARSLVLLGNLGGSIWPAFAGWRRSYDGPDPLDTWSKQRIRPLADELGATAYFPSDPPWQPFQQWAMKAEELRPSPLGILIHPQYGVWHGYRGALGFPFETETNAAKSRHPCDSCLEKPCLTACPAHAIRLSGFDIAACRSHLAGERGQIGCMVYGCLARNACPVGAEFRYPPEQLRFHMEALI